MAIGDGENDVEMLQARTLPLATFASYVLHFVSVMSLQALH